MKSDSCFDSLDLHTQRTAEAHDAATSQIIFASILVSVIFYTHQLYPIQACHNDAHLHLMRATETQLGIDY
jgi:hypothetical protein